MRNQHPVDALCDLLLEEDLQTSYTALSGDASSLGRFIAHPLSMVGSDAVLLGEFPSPADVRLFSNHPGVNLPARKASSACRTQSAR